MSEPKSGLRWTDRWSRERVVALSAALVALAVLLMGLVRQPDLYLADYGQYEQYMRQCGLALPQDLDTTDEAYFSTAITRLEYKHVSLMKLFTPTAGYTVAYAAALVRLMTKPFGLPFSADLLAVVWIVALAGAVYLLTYHLMRISRCGGWIPAVLLCMIFSDGNFVALLRGLYPEGGAIVMTLLYIGCVLWALDLVKSRRRVSLIGLSAVSVLFLKSAAMMLVFLPVAVAVLVWVANQEQKQGLTTLMHLALAAALMFTGAVGAARVAAADTDYFSTPARYESVFHVYLDKSDDPKAALASFGLDESYLPDIGKTYYEEPSTFAHPPTDAAEAEKLSGLTVGRTVMGYLTHPATLLRAIREIPTGGDGYINVRNVAAERTETGFLEKRADGGLFSPIRGLLPSSWTFFAACMLLGGAALLIAACLRRDAGRRGEWIILGCAMLCAALYLPVCVVMNGYSLCAEYMLYQVFLQDLFWIGAVTALSRCFLSARVWMTRFEAHPVRLPGIPAERTANLAGSHERASGLRRRIGDWQKGVCADRRKTVAVIAVLAVGMSLVTLLKPDRAACVNNGDFERMMSSIDLTWTEEAATHPDGTSLHWVFEDYDWTAPFNWKRLTPLKASYSLYFFETICRPFTSLIGRPMNTFLLEWVMTAFAIAAILLLTRDLFDLLGKWTLLFGALLCAIFLSETSITWYNGLFGEGCVMLGLLLSCACATHVALMPRQGIWKRLIWFALLAYSLYIMTTSKAQMLLAMPFAALLLIALVIAHWPKRPVFRAAVALCLVCALAFIGLGTLREYTGERNEDSGAQMHTMWQAYFYGIFMISDDPIADMEALGIDTAMAPDIGKYVDFSEDAQYVYHPLSDEAKERFTNHVSTAKIIIWYVTHPTKMIYMLNHAANIARQIYTGFRAYKSQDYWDWVNRDTVDGMGLWMYWRESMVPSTFYGYFAFYLGLLAWIVWTMVRGRGEEGRRARLLCLVMLFIMMTGIFQYPLSVLGNGFADNHKQLFCFSLCHDLLLMIILVLCFRYLDTQSIDTIRERWKARFGRASGRRNRRSTYKGEGENHAVQLD